MIRPSANQRERKPSGREFTRMNTIFLCGLIGTGRMTGRVVHCAFWLLVLLLGAARTAVAQNESIDQLLDRTGRSVSSFLEKLADVTCNEEVLQEKFNLKGKLEERVQSTFEYLVLPQNQGSEPVLFESRQALREAHARKNISLLISNGFATQLLIFHPYYQSAFTFERMPDVHVNGKTYAQVRFQHIKGRVTPAALLLRGREYPMSLAGTALIDPGTAAVERITTELGASMEDLGLKTFHSEVEYAPVDFPRSPKIYYLPAQATIEVSTPRQHWKNIHRFTNYRLFSVSVEEKVDTEKIKTKEQDP